MIKKLQKYTFKLNDFSLKVLLLSIFIYASVQTSVAQDYNYSQFYNTPLNTNPALTGRIDHDIRVGAIFRNQWQSYNTLSFNGDMNFHKNPFQADLLGAGLNFVNDQSPDGTFLKQYIMVSGAFHHWLDDDKRHRFSFGLQPGLTIQSVNSNPSKVIFENPDNTTGANKVSFTINTGLVYEFIATRKTSMSIGLALFNFTSPKDGLLNTRSPVRWNINPSVSYKITPKLTLTPSLLYTNMASSSNFLMGSNLAYSVLPKKDKNTFIASVGAWYRLNDAAIIYGGLRYNNIQIGLSYDFTTSSLSSDAKTFGSKGALGAFEISLVYVGFLRRGIPGGVSIPCKTF